MSLGIRLPTEEGSDDYGFWIYFDAVTQYNRSLKGQVTKNPTARGRNSTDNFTPENPSFSFTGIISFADISTIQHLIKDEDGSSPNNTRSFEVNAAIIQNSSSRLINLLPDSISQFLPANKPTVIVDPVGSNMKTFVESCLVKLMSGSYYNQATGKTQTKIRPVILCEFEGTQITKRYEDLCLISVDIKETVDSGNSLFCDLQFEQVNFVTLKTTALSADVVKALKSKAAPKAKKGNVPKVDEQKDLSDDLEDINPTRN
ncbi:MAG: hypothetical protein PUP93_06730 [Rhizonema sp. NSF051]|nr:hypothetical protein [Rhizonema sp. NSF051]